MTLRKRAGVWHYRFKLDRKEYSGKTDLAATKQNMTKALEVEAEHRSALREGHRSPRRILVREFNDAAKEFLEWIEVEHRDHPNSHRRIATSFASAKQFFGRQPVSMVDEVFLRLTRHGVYGSTRFATSRSGTTFMLSRSSLDSQ